MPLEVAGASVAPAVPDFVVEVGSAPALPVVEDIRTTVLIELADGCVDVGSGSIFVVAVVDGSAVFFVTGVVGFVFGGGG